MVKKVNYEALQYQVFKLSLIAYISKILWHSSIYYFITFAHYVVVSFWLLSPDGGRLSFFLLALVLELLCPGLNKIAKLDDTTEYYKLLYYSDS